MEAIKDIYRNKFNIRRLYRPGDEEYHTADAKVKRCEEREKDADEKLAAITGNADYMRLKAIEAEIEMARRQAENEAREAREEAVRVQETRDIDNRIASIKSRIADFKQRRSRSEGLESRKFKVLIVELQVERAELEKWKRVILGFDVASDAEQDSASESEED